MKLKENLASEYSIRIWQNVGNIEDAYLAGFEAALRLTQDYYNDNLDSEYINFEELGEEQV